ncbi:MAG: tetratricopeptide repeat protein [Oscillospiraceae bacterium]|jgi:tetratricopeptide (TPR) repeat protein|nr:tetratricopeptide repeat protein [Oscillospiraceae bacterium]
MRRITAFATAVILSLTVFGCGKKSAVKYTPSELIGLGDKYLLDLDFEQAVVYFELLIELEPKNPRGYTGLAEAYIGLGETEKAVRTLEKGARKADDAGEIEALLEALLAENPGAAASPPDENDGENGGEDGWHMLDYYVTAEQYALVQRLSDSAEALDCETAFGVISSPEFEEITQKLPFSRDYETGEALPDNRYAQMFFTTDSGVDYTWDVNWFLEEDGSTIIMLNINHYLGERTADGISYGQYPRSEIYVHYTTSPDGSSFFFKFTENIDGITDDYHYISNGYSYNYNYGVDGWRDGGSSHRTTDTNTTYGNAVAGLKDGEWVSHSTSTHYTDSVLEYTSENTFYTTFDAGVYVTDRYYNELRDMWLYGTMSQSYKDQINYAN